MAKNIKIDRKELAQDEVAQTVEDLIAAGRRNFLKIIIVGGGAIAIIIASTLFRNNARQARIDDSETLQSAALIFAQLPMLEDENERRRRLQSTIDGLDDMIERHGGTPAALQARLLKGNCYYAMADPNNPEAATRDIEQAEAAFNEFLDRASDPADKARGYIALGYAKENLFYIREDDLGLLAEANVNYVRAEEAAPGGSYIYYDALMNRARVLEFTSDFDGAADLYRQVMRERALPRTRTVAGPESPEDDTSIEGLLRTQAEQGAEPLSFYFTAKLRLDRLEATSNIFTANPGNPGNPGNELP